MDTYTHPFLTPPFFYFSDQKNYFLTTEKTIQKSFIHVLLLVLYCDIYLRSIVGEIILSKNGGGVAPHVEEEQKDAFFSVKGGSREVHAIVLGATLSF